MLDRSDDVAARAAFRRLYSGLLTKIADHQARWSAVNLSDTDEDYARSAQTIDQASMDLIHWVRANAESI